MAMTCCDKYDNTGNEWGMPNNSITPGGGGIGGGGFGGGMGNGSASDDGDKLGIDNTIKGWDGTKASDSSKDAVGSDNDIYHEANSWTNKVTVTFSGSSAQVTTSDSKILTNVSNGYVAIDMLTNSVSGVEIELKGSSTDGGVKIYGEKKFKLTLNDLSLKSTKGPAINSQCKKRVFLHVADGTSNTIEDAATYTDDPYYLDATQSEDRKGCFFSEGNVIMSGTGVLQVTGNYKHAFCTDNSFIMRPGASLVINGAAKNGLHVKGNDDIGVKIMGGYIYANVSGSAGKAIKCDLDVEILGGTLDLNTSGNAVYDSDDKDTSSASGIKTDGSIIISGGEISAKSTGSGGKGLSADTDINVSGGEITIATNGSKYTYSQELTSSPKGIRADGNITISGGAIKIAATGRNDGAEGMESKATMTISGGDVQVYAYDDAINAATALNITGGYVYAYAINNDGIDSNGSFTISGGTVIGAGTSAPESGIDCDNSSRFLINGGDVLAIGGTLQASPSSSSGSYCAVCSSASVKKGAALKVLDSSSKTMVTFTMPRTISGGTMLISSSSLKASNTYTVTADGTTLCSFTTSSKIVSAK